MGCDIHVHSEVKVNGQWHHCDKVRIERDYGLFGFLAGVRCSGQAFGLKGIPEDASVVTRLDCDRMKCDGHSHSWISVDEIAQTVKHFPSVASFSTGSFLFGNSYEHFFKYRKDYPSEIEDVRWVFWFDG